MGDAVAERQIDYVIGGGVDMYEWLSKMSNVISEPVTALVDSYAGYPLIAAFLLGLLGAAAPCQLTGNISAMTLYGNRTVQKKSNWREISFFIAGKVLVFCLIGWSAWIFGENFESELTQYFPYVRKVIGPVIIITGLVLLGLLKLRLLNRATQHIPLWMKGGRFGSFLLGASFSLAFCPTMFVLFFLWLMPMVMTAPYGFILPVMFGVATSLPLLLLYFFIWFFDARKTVMKSSLKVGRFIQRLAGILLVAIGIIDTLTYWGI